MTTNLILEKALAWAEAEVEVIPLARMANRPHPMLGSGWTRRSVGSTDSSIIKEWWANDPAANLGIVNDTGGLLIMDIDVKHGVDGMKSVMDLEAWAEEELPTGAWVSTPSGGKHIYYRTGRRNNPGTLNLPITGMLPGIDFPWQVASAPSGRELKVTDPMTGEIFSTIGEYIEQPASEMPRAPGWLLDLIKASGRGHGPMILAQSNQMREHSTLPPVTEFEERGFGFVTGSRNQDAFKLASKMFTLTSGDSSSVRFTMYTIWQATPQPPGDLFPWHECEKCISQAERYFNGGYDRDRAMALGIVGGVL